MMVRRFSDDSADFFWAWGILPCGFSPRRGEDAASTKPTPVDAASSPRHDQATSVFLEIERLLAQEGMTFANVVRTWFYNDDINGWYAEFNAARTRFFESRRVFETFLPASTGIGHSNPFGAALTAGVLAMRPKNASAKAEIVKSPLQTDAMTYRSSFSRAAEVTSASGRRLFVSGTASILPNSCEVAFPGDYDRQVDCAMRAALAIVESRGMSIANVTRAIAYLRDRQAFAPWQRWLREQGLPENFATVMDAEVCRPDWLFEIELDAVQDANDSQ